MDTDNPPHERKAAVGAAPQLDPQEETFTRQRQEMVRSQLASRDIQDARVLMAMGRVPRHRFVPDDLHKYAYDDGPLPIGQGQTISQPYIVALMTQLVEPGPDERVLEIGTGSGYQAAVLAELAGEVVGIERVPLLAGEAEARLRALGYANVSVHVGDGSLGFAEEAPYDGILVAAAAPRIPEALLEQLAEGGRLVIPVGDSKEQMLERAWRRGASYHIERLVPVRFVPLIGDAGFTAGTF
jgi:protein-L-isoaspartate(D-aspartate) O-methyltransferase